MPPATYPPALSGTRPGAGYPPGPVSLPVVLRELGHQQQLLGRTVGDDTAAVGGDGEGGEGGGRERRSPAWTRTMIRTEVALGATSGESASISSASVEAQFPLRNPNADPNQLRNSCWDALEWRGIPAWGLVAA